MDIRVSCVALVAVLHLTGGAGSIKNSWRGKEQGQDQDQTNDLNNLRLPNKDQESSKSVIMLYSKLRSGNFCIDKGGFLYVYKI